MTMAFRRLRALRDLHALRDHDPWHHASVRCSHALERRGRHDLHRARALYRRLCCRGDRVLHRALASRRETKSVAQWKQR